LADVCGHRLAEMMRNLLEISLASSVPASLRNKIHHSPLDPCVSQTSSKSLSDVLPLIRASLSNTFYAEGWFGNCGYLYWNINDYCNMGYIINLRKIILQEYFDWKACQFEILEMIKFGLVL
jgi:hypothetical protein